MIGTIRYMPLCGDPNTLRKNDELICSPLAMNLVMMGVFVFHGVLLNNFIGFFTPN